MQETTIEALLDAGADPMAPNAAGETPWDLAKANKALKGSDAYWRLNEARFEAPGRRGARVADDRAGRLPATRAMLNWPPPPPAARRGA